MLNIFGMKKPVRAPAADMTDLLSTLRPNSIPDPVALRAALDDLTRQIEAGDAEWERLELRGDAAAFLQFQPLAQRLQELRAQAALLPDQIAGAERRRDAFVQRSLTGPHSCKRRRQESQLAQIELEEV